MRDVLLDLDHGDDDTVPVTDMGPGCAAVFVLGPDRAVYVEPIAGATRLHVFSVPEPHPIAEYDYVHAFDALRAVVEMGLASASEPAGPWYRRRIGPCVEYRSIRLND